MRTQLLRESAVGKVQQRTSRRFANSIRQYTPLPFRREMRADKARAPTVWRNPFDPRKPATVLRQEREQLSESDHDRDVANDRPRRRWLLAVGVGQPDAKGGRIWRAAAVLINILISPEIGLLRPQRLVTGAEQPHEEQDLSAMFVPNFNRPAC